MLLARWGSKNGLVYICRKQTSSNSILVVTRSSPFWSKVVHLQSMLSHIFGWWTGWKISSTPFIIKKKKQIVKLKHEKTCYIYKGSKHKENSKAKSILKIPLFIHTRSCALSLYSEGNCKNNTCIKTYKIVFLIL